MAVVSPEHIEAEMTDRGERIVPIEFFISSMHSCEVMLKRKEIPKGGYEHIERYRQQVDAFLKRFQEKIDSLGSDGATQAPERELNALMGEAQEILNSITEIE